MATISQKLMSRDKIRASDLVKVLIFSQAKISDFGHIYDRPSRALSGPNHIHCSARVKLRVRVKIEFDLNGSSRSRQER